jgi:hypothetical protein
MTCMGHRTVAGYRDCDSFRYRRHEFAMGFASLNPSYESRASRRKAATKRSTSSSSL